MTNLRTQMIERIDEVIPTCILHGSWAPQMAERIADAVLSVLSAAPAPDEDEVERVARAIKDVVIPTTGDPLGVTIYESEAVVGSNADEAKESLIEICRIAARAAIAAMRPTETPTPGEKVIAGLQEAVRYLDKDEQRIMQEALVKSSNVIRPTLSPEDRAGVEEVRGRANTFSGRFWGVGPQTRVAMIEQIVGDRAFLLSLVDKLAGQP